jgi:hypothetical protein
VPEHLGAAGKAPTPEINSIFAIFFPACFLLQHRPVVFSHNSSQRCITIIIIMSAEGSEWFVVLEKAKQYAMYIYSPHSQCNLVDSRINLWGDKSN